MTFRTSFRCKAAVLVSLAMLAPGVQAQFVDTFESAQVQGWSVITGDGDASLELAQQGGTLRYAVDATRDRYGVWWTCMKRDITRELDLKRLSAPAYELRVEAKVRGSHAPRRVNFMINTQRTTDYHEHLREYELRDTTSWHTISMTTRNLDVVPGDTLFAQFCVTDWGPGRYEVQMDHYKADVVRANRAAPDVGEPLVYHPPVESESAFTHHVSVRHDSVVNRTFPQVNFNGWRVDAQTPPAHALTIAADQWIVLRWDAEQLASLQTAQAGLLELTTHSIAMGGNYEAGLGKDLGEEFGKVRVIEVLGGDASWAQDAVTYDSLTQGRPYEDVFNTQMTIDLELAKASGEKAYFTLPRPVMERLLRGETKGLLIRPLGALIGSVYASEDPQGRGPKLHVHAVEQQR